MEKLDREERINKLQCEINQLDDDINKLMSKKNRLVKLLKELKKQNELTNSLSVNTTEYENENYKWSNDLRENLKNIFNLNDFRPQQLSVMNIFLSNRDILYVAPTGGGKSLCYQLPAVTGNGLTLVISPLISLMKDQIWHLKKLKIKAELLTNSSDKNHVNEIHKKISTGCDSLKLIYVTPERMAKSKRFMSSLQKCYSLKKFKRIAIDEVHCCSQWGHDYRPDYKYLGVLKQLFPNTPILGVTATATSKIIMDTIEILNLKNSITIRSPFNRPNLYYHVMEKPSEKEQMYSILSDLLRTRYKNKSGIIYTFSIKDSEELAKALCQRECKVRAYHANLNENFRNKIHEKWLNNDIQAVVATVAFGMGIDKPDVRFVIHHTMSKSIENFYQESGRAGRDGKISECILFYKFSDLSKISTMVFSEQTGLKNAYAMLEYCINGDKCRREMISSHFTESWSTKDCQEMCDFCLNKQKLKINEINIIPHCIDLIEIIEFAFTQDTKLTSLKLLDSWYHKGQANLRISAIKPPLFNRLIAEQIIGHLLLLGYLKEDFHYTAYSTISYIQPGDLFCDNDEKILIKCSQFVKLPKYNEINHKMIDFSINQSKRPHSIDRENESTHKKFKNDIILSSSTQSDILIVPNDVETIEIDD